jgi:hypothetical protein
MPAIANGAGADSAMDALAMGSSASPDRDRSTGSDAVMQAIRDLGRQIEALGKQLPTAQAEVQQLRQVLKRLIIKAGQIAPKETASARAVPGGPS